MGKLIVATFLLLGFGFYELSGGADFVPEERPIAVAEVTTTPLAPAVTRAESISLVTLASVETTELVEPIAESTAVVPVIAEIAPVIEDIVEEPVAVAAVEPEVVEESSDLRTVAGSRVNMRAGPGTSYNVLDTLVAGTWTEVLEIDSEGWARIRNMDTGQEGWMAERLLSS